MRGETPSRQGSARVQKSGHVDDDVQISALDAFCEMDGRRCRYIGEVLEWYRGEDAGDLKRSELNELNENLTCLKALDWKIWKSYQKVVMDEELVLNDVMDEKLVQNFVMKAQIDPNVVMDLSIFKIGGWNSLQPINQNLFEEFIDENEPWLLIGIPSRDPFLVTQYLERHSVSSDQHIKKMVSLLQGLHVMMQCYMRQHFADRYWLHEHPGGHASWREPTMRKFTKESTTYFVKGLVCRWNVQKMRSESSEYVRKTTGFFTNSWEIKIALEAYFEVHAKEVWERNWMNLEMQTTLLNTYPPKMNATILKALRGQLKENDQLNAVEEIAGPVPEIPLEYDRILKEGRFLDDVNGGICPKILCWLRDVKRLTGYILKVSTRLFQCKSAEMRA